MRRYCTSTPATGHRPDGRRCRRSSAESGCRGLQGTAVGRRYAVRIRGREPARLSGVSATMIGKEMHTLTSAGIAIERKDGNRRVFQANAKCPIVAELQSIARKTSGIADLIREGLGDIGGIESAFIFGSVAKGEERADSDVDLCVVGRVSHNDVLNAMSNAERTIGRKINPVVYSPEEFRRKSADGNPLVSNMRSGERINLIGEVDESARKFRKSGPTRPSEARKPKRDGNR